MLKFPEDKTSIAYKIRELIYKNLPPLFKERDIKIVLEHPENEEHGDYSSNIAMKIAQNAKRKTQNYNLRLKAEEFKNPRKIAELIVENLPKADSIEKVKVAGSGFINFWLSEKWLLKQVSEALKKKDGFGKFTIGKGKKVMVEFAHPNTHKPFHLGHLRNICLGESISRLLVALGGGVIRTNYQGDVGLHIAKCLWGILQNQKSIRQLADKMQSASATGGWRTKFKNLKSLDEKIDFLGKAYAAGHKAYESDKKAKEEIIKINHQIYKKDPAVASLWRETRQWSLDYFGRIYQRLDSKFDRLYFESECLEGTKIAKKALEKGILVESKGAVVFPGEKYGLDTRVFITADGLPTYEAKELKLAQMEFSEHGELDQVIHVVGPEQISFFKVTFKVEELLDERKYEDKQYHRIYGWVRLKKGKMSSRAGEVVTAEWLLEEVKKRIKQVMGKVKKSKIGKNAEKIGKNAEIIAVAAVKYSMLKLNPEKELVFDIDESINLQGDSGPYLQYTYARCQSVLRKAKRESTPEASQGDTSEVTRRGSSDGGGIGERGEFSVEELAVLRTLYKFPEVVLEAGRAYAPNLLCSYLYDLATKFNTFYNHHRIIGSNHEQFRLSLTASVAQVLKNGLNLLGIKALERM